MTAKQQPVNGKTSYELVTVIMRQADYDQLDKRRLPMDVQVSLALQHYLKLIQEGKWLAESANFTLLDCKWKSVQCALSKQLCDQVRGLMGRFDFHTLQAVRLYLL
jgi:hypothetical protein